MTKSERRDQNLPSGSSTTTRSMAARVEKLERSLHQDIKDLKDQLLASQETPKTPGEISTIIEKIESFEKHAMEAITEMRGEIANMEQSVVNCKQEMYLNSLVIKGLKENHTGDSIQNVCSFFKNQLKINVIEATSIIITV